MKRYYVASGILLALILAGCGENWSAGGASLGGTGGGAKPGNGTGTGVDEGNGSGGPTDQRPINQEETIKYTTYNLPVVDQCGVVQRKMYFLDNQGQPVSRSIQQEYGDGVQVKVELTNTASYPVFERQHNCRAAFDVLDIYSDTDPAAIIKPRRSISCDDDVTWRVLQPQQTQTYTFYAGDNYLSEDMTPGKIQHFKVAYTPEFVQQPQAGLPLATADSMRCPALEVFFNTVNKTAAGDTTANPSEDAEDKSTGIVP